jgi:hypothetical protein
VVAPKSICSCRPGAVSNRKPARSSAPPKGPDKTELQWIYIGFEEDDADMTALRLAQANLVAPAGYVSMEDGAVGNFIQRAIHGTERLKKTCENFFETNVPLADLVNRIALPRQGGQPPVFMRKHDGSCSMGSLIKPTARPNSG